ncbi:hypothetical protein COU58_01305 [Candidatus Pacearchaeota archaeon CG10_big_fil_rev_8_21_14_0_10_32_42]|nr:MAG: hypothetical protein COU58_01305 [Candidatus Pacearchaeota archaeon CG10_big_fil_rev_8_21_14_0_10_32_42]
MNFRFTWVKIATSIIFFIFGFTFREIFLDCSKFDFQNFSSFSICYPISNFDLIFGLFLGILSYVVYSFFEN